MEKKLVVCLTGPSGVGKTSYAKRICTELNFCIPEVVTTREKRKDDGPRYRYVKNDRFNEMVNQNLLIEYDLYLTYYYGTLRGSINEILTSNNFSGAVLDLTPAGCMQIKEKIKNALIIAIVPDDREWLKQRLLERNSQDSSEIEIRTGIVDEYLEQIAALSCFTVASSYSSDTWDKTFEQIVEVINSEKHTG